MDVILNARSAALNMFMDRRGKKIIRRPSKTDFGNMFEKQKVAGCGRGLRVMDTESLALMNVTNLVLSK